MPAWADLSDRELLALPLADLALPLEASAMAPRVRRLARELAARGLNFRPDVWFSSTWFAPDGVPGFALPFYLAHPRLVRLERGRMGEAEGATEASAMALLRHECGHALDTAYGLHRRSDWRRIFGRYSEPYRRSYRARPGSPDFVIHLPRWYAQSHPAEDWAETFAVWLAGGRPRGLGPGARAKLAYVGERMAELAGKRPTVRLRERTEELGGLAGTVGQHYRARLRRQEREGTAPFARDLEALFPIGGRPGAGGHLEGVGRRWVRAAADTYSRRQVLDMLKLHARRRGLGLPAGRAPGASALTPVLRRTLDLVARGRTLLWR